ATIYLQFTDGDGNFGLEEGDTMGPFEPCIRRYNLFARYFELENGAWVDKTVDPCFNPNLVSYYYIVPWAKPSGQNQTQQGEIKLDMGNMWYEESPFDTVKFDIYIVDRDFNESGVVTTGKLVKP